MPLQVIVGHPKGVLGGSHLLQQQLRFRIIVLRVRANVREELRSRRFDGSRFLPIHSAHFTNPRAVK